MSICSTKQSYALLCDEKTDVSILLSTNFTISVSFQLLDINDLLVLMGLLTAVKLLLLIYCCCYYNYSKRKLQDFTSISIFCEIYKSFTLIWFKNLETSTLS